MRDQLREVETELSEAKTKSFQQGDQMREARKAKRVVDQQNESLTIQLKEVQVKWSYRIKASNQHIKYLISVLFIRLILCLSPGIKPRTTRPQAKKILILYC